MFVERLDFLRKRLFICGDLRLFLLYVTCISPIFL